MNCTSRLSLCDMGWHECQLEQNHKDSHKFVDKEDGYRHSKWLNMMEKRLRLTGNLLTDDGVVFM